MIPNARPIARLVKLRATRMLVAQGRLHPIEQRDKRVAVDLHQNAHLRRIAERHQAEIVRLGRARGPGFGPASSEAGAGFSTSPYRCSSGRGMQRKTTAGVISQRRFR
jgi:hypothetical protein